MCLAWTSTYLVTTDDQYQNCLTLELGSVCVVVSDPVYIGKLLYVIAAKSDIRSTCHSYRS